MAHNFQTLLDVYLLSITRCNKAINALGLSRLCYASVTASILACTVFLSTFANAQEDGAEGPAFVYIALDPDIITNYAGDNSQRLGYLRIAVEMMLEDPSDLMEIEHHMPLLRSIAIEVIGTQTEQQVKSLTGRENMRREILSKFRDSLIKETQKEIIKDIIFTKYLRQGG